jgi:hypothetical protein
MTQPELELLRVGEEFHVSLLLHGRPAPTPAVVAITIEGSKQAIKMVRMRGGQVLRFPPVEANSIIASLERGAPVEIALRGYRVVIDPTGFSDSYSDLKT